MREVSAVVPAAGLSSRFGGPNKMLAPWYGRTVVGSVVSVLLECDLPTVVVTGRDSDLVAKEVAPANSVYNPDYMNGLGGSIAVGVAQTPPDHAVLIVLGDMPRILPGVISALVERLQSASTDAIIAPVYSDEPDRIGHPVLFSAEYRVALMALKGDAGASSIIRANDDALVRISFAGGLDDMDTPEGLARDV